MQKDHLPKLELGGFIPPCENAAETAGKQKDTAPRAGWRETASRMMKKAGVKIVWKKEKEEDDIDIGYKRLLIKTGICAAIAITILVISTVTTPNAQQSMEPSGETLSQEFDIDEDIGKLKFVENLDGEAESVMSVLPNTAVVYPSDGEIITAFGQSGAKGVRFSSEGTTAYSIAKATVTATGEIDGQGYVKLLLDTGETVLYCNIEPLVQVDDIVGAGQVVGTLSGDYLYVEMEEGDMFVDPVAYINSYTSE